MTIAPLLAISKEQGRSEEDCALIRRAYDFAAEAHRGQKRKSGKPYLTHPLEIALRLARLKLDAVTIAAALLHDVCEDTSCTGANLKKLFGEEVAFLVEGVTKLDKLKYRGAERSAESLRKMFLAIGEDIRVVLLKLVDRWHNMETLKVLPLEKQRRIALETLEIYAPLAYRLGIKDLSGILEDLAFPIVLPKEYEWLTKITKHTLQEQQRTMEKARRILSQELAKEDISFLDLHARVKHFYSLYKKLLRYDMDLEKVTDIVALRLILPTIEDCYTALGFIHTLWRPLPGKIKDYIALPKPNGYRSLHTTVFGPDEKIIEIQMRTPAMHEEAEYGIAAHWAYAELKRKDPVMLSGTHGASGRNHSTSWIGQLAEWQKQFEKPVEFLESLKIDFFKNRIFVITPKGDVIDLPEGSTPVDFAYEIHTDIGHATVGAKVNGKIVPLDHLLKNGDVVEIVTGKRNAPNRDWLSFLKSPQARKKVATMLKKARETETLERSQKKELVELRLTVQNRIGLLSDVSRVLAQSKINMEKVVTENRRRHWPTVIIRAPFKGKTELEKIMVRLKTVKGVEEVGYKMAGT